MSLASQLGINAHLLNNPAHWAAVCQLGVTIARIDLNFDSCQPAIDRYDWDVTDTAVSNARAVGLHVYATISHTPAWANDGAGRGVPATSIMDWTRFVEAAGRRYHNLIRYWSIWNEFQGSVFDYVMYLWNPAHEVLKSIDANHVLCGPEIATEGDWDGWLSTFLRQVARPPDIISVHAYEPSGARVWDKITKHRRWWELLLGHKPSIRQVIEQAGYGDVPCWITETGMDSMKTSEAEQANFYDQLLERWAPASWPQRLFCYQHVDEDTHGFGLFHPDWSEKPAARIVRSYAQR